MADPPDRPCPDCGARIGNHRRACSTCNRFAQAVNRKAANLLRDAYPRDYADCRTAAEATIYHELTSRLNVAARYGGTP